MEFPDIRQLLPHRSPAIVLDRVLDFSPPRGVCEVILDERFPYAEGGAVKSILGIEMVAQGVAAFASLSRRSEGDEGRPKHGYIVSVTSADFACADFPLETPLRVEVEEIWSQGPAGSFSGRVCDGERTLMSVRLSVLESDGVG